MLKAARGRDFISRKQSSQTAVYRPTLNWNGVFSEKEKMIFIRGCRNPPTQKIQGKPYRPTLAWNRIFSEREKIIFIPDCRNPPTQKIQGKSYRPTLSWNQIFSEREKMIFFRDCSWRTNDFYGPILILTAAFKAFH